MKYTILTLLLLLCVFTSCAGSYTQRTQYRTITVYDDTVWHNYDYYGNRYHRYHYRNSYHWRNQYNPNYYGRNFYMHAPIITTRYGEKVYRIDRHINNTESNKINIRIKRRKINRINNNGRRR